MGERRTITKPTPEPARWHPAHPPVRSSRESAITSCTSSSSERSLLSQAIALRARGQGPWRAGDIADIVAYIVTRDRRVAVNEVLIRAGEQTW
jgi:NADP-dependent 3-hydroxy acid dehydrogenase YdfG